MNVRLKQVAGMIALACLLVPGMAQAFGPGACGEGHPPLPPFIADQYDADGDGRLSAAEEETARQALLERYDTDGDGELSRTERQALMQASREAFVDRYDADGDGVISEEEHAASRADFVARFDADGDGELSEDELPDRRPGRGRPFSGGDAALRGPYEGDAPQ